MDQAIRYPKWIYHATLAARVVESCEEQEALGEGWSESPVEAPTAPPVLKVPQTPPPAPESAPAAEPTAEAPVPAPTEQVPLQSRLVIELKDILKDAGVPEAEFKDKKKAELIEMIEQLADKA